MTNYINNFDTPALDKLMNIPNVWDRYFNGLAIYKGKKVQAPSKDLNGMMEFGNVIDFCKVGKNYHLQIEFCGDDGLWKEWVCVYDVQAYNIDAYIDFNDNVTS